MKQLEINFMNQVPANRYSQEDLLIFKLLIEKKLNRAIETFNELKDILTGGSENNTDDTSWSFKADDGAQNSTKDETTILAHKQEVFIMSLQNALTRIEKGTYGICINSGELIDKNRLMAVPNTTTSLIAKIELTNQVLIQIEINNQTDETEK